MSYFDGLCVCSCGDAHDVDAGPTRKHQTTAQESSGEMSVKPSTAQQVL